MTQHILKDKAVIVTGAASGLGRAVAVAFARVGARVAIVDFNAAGLEETAGLARAEGAEALILPADLSDVAQCRSVIEKGVSGLGGLDALCNVAGLLHINQASNITPETWDKVFAVNVRAPFFLIQTALPHLIERSGAVVNIASASAFVGSAYLSPYAASKAALVNLTKTLAMEYVQSPIRINAIAPGGMNTGMIFAEMPEGIDFSLMARYAGLRGIAQPEDFTELVLFLASSAGKAVHGACFNVDGGATAG